MVCQHRGPWHLGISNEACENAGGKWYRTPCVTLQGIIDESPSRFALDAPFDGSCNDHVQHFNTAFVSLNRSLLPYLLGESFEGWCLDATGKYYGLVSGGNGEQCWTFCGSLPNVQDQIGITVRSDACECNYKNGSLPSEADLNDLQQEKGISASRNSADGTGSGPVVGGSGDSGYVCYPIISHHSPREAWPTWPMHGLNTVCSVKIQLKWSSILNLAEVEVFTSDDQNVAKGKVATPSRMYEEVTGWELSSIASSEVIQHCEQ